MDAGSPADETRPAPVERAANRSVDRASRLLSVFSLEDPALSLAELARRVELPKATVHRLASALLAGGLLTQGADGRYGLGVKMLELGAIVRENLDIVQLTRPAVEMLARASGETVLVATVDWSTRELLLVERRDSPHPLAVGSPVGRRQPIPPGGALGKAVLSGLVAGEATAVVNELTLVATTAKTPIERRRLLRDIAKARDLGYAAEQDEYIDGVSGVAVPVVFEGGHPLAALGLVGPTSRLAGEIASLGTLLLAASATLRPVSSRRGSRPTA